jgi:anti-anti-sigma regulatory factor
MAFTIPYTIITQGICAGLISTIGTMTFGSYRLIKSVCTHKNPDINKLIGDLDIERRLKLIKSVVDAQKYGQCVLKNNSLEYSNSHCNNVLESTIIQSADNPIELCLSYLQETITNIHMNLFDINNKVIYHKTKWFNSWRTLNIKRELEALRLNSNLLESRFNDFIEISKLMSNEKI